MWKLPKQRYFRSTEISQKILTPEVFFLMIPSLKGNPNPIAPLSLKSLKSLTFSPGDLCLFSQVPSLPRPPSFSTFPPGWSWRGDAKAVQGMSGESLRLCGALGGQLEGRDLRSWKVWWRERMNTAKKNKAFFLVSPSKLTKTNNFSWCNMARGNFHHLLDSVLCERSIWNWNASLGTREPSRDKKNLRDIWVVFYLCPWFCWEAQKIIYIHGMKFNRKFAFEAKIGATNFK